MSLLAVVALLLASLSGVAQERPRVLFVGNSYTAVNNLPQLVQSVAQSMGDDITYGSSTPGGCTFQQHCNNESMALIRQGGWDYVVLQEQSQLPSFPQSQVESQVFPYAARLVDSVYANSPCAEPMFYMTWGRKNGDQDNAIYFPVLGTYEGMDSMLAVRYTYMAEVNDASLCPVGRVWRYLRDNHSDIELYQGDGSHPSLAGSYAAACAFYVMFFHRNPEEISYDAGLGSVVASTIREAVKLVVYDHLADYRRPEPVAAFGDVEADGLEVTFGCAAQHSERLVWHFGDGDTLESGVGSVQHTYAAAGQWEVVQVAMRHCMADSVAMPLTVTAGEVGLDAAEAASVKVYPNPVSDRLLVQLGEEMKGAVVGLYSAEGLLVRCVECEGAEVALDMSRLPAGCYLLVVRGERSVQVKKIIKE